MQKRERNRRDIWSNNIWEFPTFMPNIRTTDKKKPEGKSSCPHRSKNKNYIKRLLRNHANTRRVEWKLREIWFNHHGKQHGDLSINWKCNCHMIQQFYFWILLKGNEDSPNSKRYTVVAPWKQGLCSKTHRGCLKPWIEPNPTYVYIVNPWKSHGQRSLVQATIHGVSKSQARLSDFTFFHNSVKMEIKDWKYTIYEY